MLHALCGYTSAAIESPVINRNVVNVLEGTKMALTTVVANIIKPLSRTTQRIPKGSASEEGPTDY